MKKLIGKKNIIKILVIMGLVILCSSRSAAVGIEVIYVASYVDETEVKIQVEINLTLPYIVYENDSEIANGTLLAYTLANITTARNVIPGVMIQHSLFINDTSDYYNHIWLNFSYYNYPEIAEFGLMVFSIPMLMILIVAGTAIKKKRKYS